MTGAAGTTTSRGVVSGVCELEPGPELAGGEPGRRTPPRTRPHLAAQGRAGAGLSAAGGVAWRAAGRALSCPDWVWGDQEAVSWRGSTGRHWAVEEEGVAS